jgi:hypothetical protein
MFRGGEIYFINFHGKMAGVLAMGHHRHGAVCLQIDLWQKHGKVKENIRLKLKR